MRNPLTNLPYIPPVTQSVKTLTCHVKPHRRVTPQVRPTHRRMRPKRVPPTPRRPPMWVVRGVPVTTPRVHWRRTPGPSPA
jgi:hypothetical protein